MTWLELKKRVFSYLELPRNTTGDLEDAVEEALFDTYQGIVSDVNPSLLITESNDVDVESTDISLSIASDFAISNLDDIYSVKVNTNPDDADSKYIEWNELSWQRYISEEENLPPCYWAQSADDKIYFTTQPAVGETWSAKIYYYKKITAYSDAGSPEIRERYHAIIAKGAAAAFPQYFIGEREELFLKVEAEFQAGIKRILREREQTRSLNRLKTRGSSGATRHNIIWS